MSKVTTAVLISGRGSNMETLIKAAQHENYPAEVVLVVSNRPKAAGLAKAKALGIPAVCLDHTDFACRKDFEQALHEILTRADIQLVCCAGFMRVLTPWLTSRWGGRMLNIHPSLLPKYKGLETHKRALENGDTVHGCTVHYVSEELDGGDIIAQAQIDVTEDDTPETLAERLIPIEHTLYVTALRSVAKSLLPAS